MTPVAGQTLADFLSAHDLSLRRADVINSWSRSQLDSALRAGDVTRILPGVYCASTKAREPVVMGRALNEWAPRGLVSGALALAIYAPNLPAPRIADLVVPHGQHMRAQSWVRLIQRAPGTVSSRPGGIECAVPARALLDAWGAAAPGNRRDMLYSALWERVCGWRQLSRELERTPRLAGRRDLERVLDWFAIGATSPLEVRARREVFVGSRFRDLEWQVPLNIPGRRARADALHRVAKVVVELDGVRFHSSDEARRKDANRDVDLAAAGYLTVRLTWRDVTERPAWCRTSLLAVIASRTLRAAST